MSPISVFMSDDFLVFAVFAVVVFVALVFTEIDEHRRR